MQHLSKIGAVFLMFDKRRDFGKVANRPEDWFSRVNSLSNCNAAFESLP